MQNAKVAKKIVISGAAIKEALERVQVGSDEKVFRISGICEKVKLKHSDVGSGLVFSGSFLATDAKGAQVEADGLVLPEGVGENIAQHMLKKKNKVKFVGDVWFERNLSARGYRLYIDWVIEPAVVGQIDFVRELIKTE